MSLTTHYITKKQYDKEIQASMYNTKTFAIVKCLYSIKIRIM